MVFQTFKLVDFIGPCLFEIEMLDFLGWHYIIQKNNEGFRTFILSFGICKKKSNKRLEFLKILEKAKSFQGLDRLKIML